MKRGKKQRRRIARKVHTAQGVVCTQTGESAMGPEIHAMHIPEGTHLERRHVCQPSHDEPVLLQTADGHVLAVVDAPPESLWPVAN